MERDIVERLRGPIDRPERARLSLIIDTALWDGLKNPPLRRKPFWRIVGGPASTLLR